MDSPQAVQEPGDSLRRWSHAFGSFRGLTPRCPPSGRPAEGTFIRYLKKLGFEGPYKGKKHDLMVKGDLRPRITNPHRGDISKDLLGGVLEQAGISKEEWRGL